MTRALSAVAVALAVACHRPLPPLRVCADPNNLPFSNRAATGFENRIASLLAADLHETLEYTWWPQRRGFIRNTLNAGVCDVVIGVPSRSGLTLNTQPYYRSAYVFVSRRDRRLDLGSLDDPRLGRLRIGVQMIGDDFNNSPPAHALSSRGFTRNVVGYTIYGDYARPAPISGIIAAVDRGDVDTAVVWGPVAGYFGRNARNPLELKEVTAGVDASIPFAFDISIGVRRNDRALHSRLDHFIARRQPEIDAILADYAVPRAGRD